MRAHSHPRSRNCAPSRCNCTRPSIRAHPGLLRLLTRATCARLPLRRSTSTRRRDPPRRLRESMSCARPDTAHLPVLLTSSPLPPPTPLPPHLLNFFLLSPALPLLTFFSLIFYLPHSLCQHSFPLLARNCDPYFPCVSYLPFPHLSITFPCPRSASDPCQSPSLSSCLYPLMII